MKKTLILALSISALVSCSNVLNTRKTSEDNQLNVELAIGGEKDEHGCITAAGETWSEVMQNCVRLIEVGLRLHPIEEKDTDVVSTFVVFDDDKSKLELFLAGDDQDALILDKLEDDEDIYLNGTYKFDGKDSTLYINDKKESQAKRSISMDFSVN